MANHDQSLSEQNEKLIRRILDAPIFQVEKKTLKNGLTVLFNKTSQRTYVTLVVYVRVGSVNDPKGKKGLAHLYEYLTLRETGDNNNIQEMSLITRRLNASTSHHATMYVSKMLKVHLPKVMELEALRLGNIASGITQPEIDKEVEVIRDEFMNKRLRETTIRDCLTRRAVFKKSHPLWSDIYGNYHDLCSITPSDVLDFEKNYSPNNMTIIVSGDFEANEVFSLANKYFGMKENLVNLIKKTNASSGTKEQKHFFYTTDTDEDMVCVCYEKPNVYTVDWVPAKAALYYLAYHYEALDKNYIAYTIYKEGLFYFRLMSDEHETVFQHFVQAMDNINYESITDSQLSKIQYELLKDLLPDSNDIFALISLAELNVEVGEPSYQKVIQRIKNLTQEDIRYAIEKYMSPKHLRTLHIADNSCLNPGVSGAKKMREERSWLSSAPKREKPSPSQLPFLRIDQIPEISTNYPSPWRFTLSNGVRVFGSTIKGSEVIEGIVLIRLEGRLKGVGFSRINYCCAQAMRGTTTLPPDKFREKVHKLDSRISDISTQCKSIEIRFVSSKKHIKALFGLLGNVLLTPYITKASVNESKDDILDNTLLSEEDQAAADRLSLFSQLSQEGNESFFRSRAGYSNNMDNISPTVVREYFSDYITPDTTDICLTGNVTEELCREALVSLETRWQGKQKVFPAPAKYETDTKPQPKGRIYIKQNNWDHENVHISLMRTIPPKKTKEFYIIHLLNTLLGENGVSSYLFRNLRIKHGHTYQVRSTIHSLDSMSCFIAEANTNIRNVAAVFKVMYDTIFGYAQAFNEEMYKYVLHKAISKNNILLENMSIELTNLRDTAFYNLDYNLSKWQNEILRNITLSEMKEVARNFFTPSEFYFIVDGNSIRVTDPLTGLGCGNPLQTICHHLDGKLLFVGEWYPD